MLERSHSDSPALRGGDALGGGVGLVMVVDTDEDAARGGQQLSGGELCFGEGLAEVVGHAHHLAGGLHLWAENGVDAGEFAPGEYRRLHEEVVAGAEYLAA